MNLDMLFGPGAGNMVFMTAAMRTPKLGLPMAHLGLYYSGTTMQGMGQGPQMNRTGHSKGMAETTPGMMPPEKKPDMTKGKYPTLEAANANRQARMPGIEGA